MKKIPITWILLIIAFSSQADDGDVITENDFSANVSFKSKSLFDQRIFLDGQPQFDSDYSRFYPGLWESALDRTENLALEIDYYAGDDVERKGFSYSLEAWYYDYPVEASFGESAETGDLGFWRYGGSLAYGFDFYLSPSLGVKLLHSPDFYVETGKATAVEGLLGLSLPANFGLNFTYGNQAFNENLNGINDYHYYDINLSKSVVGFDFTAGFTDTDDDGEIYLEKPTGDWYFSIGKIF